MKTNIETSGILGRRTKTRFIVVILTQTSLMKDQEEFLKPMGITAEFIGEDQRDEET